ncbi:MAG TPA: VOC family protein [Rhodopila sp.]|uniref:VOC family protein n=1 Tax=Rhodopila sp. TaxID=2480087 RepID=UPI002BA51E6C|nr:VOC family protein [Rhodopila sp.]HVY17809.1 VOC family protein [Rhodopila sp.]
MDIQPYVFFEGRCDEALGFYQQALGAKVEMLKRFQDAPDQSMVDPANAGKVMHASVRVGDTVFAASDGQCGGQSRFGGFALTLTVDSEADAERIFAALAEGGEVRMPMAGTFFAKRFGMLTDRFGIMWMVIHGVP